MKNSIKIKTPILLIAIAISATALTVVLAAFFTEPGLEIYLSSLIKEVVKHLLNNKFFLLYVGTVTLAICYLRQRRLLASTFIFFIGLLWLGYYKTTIGLIPFLGTDSFHEIENFEIKEAIFWLQTFVAQIQFILHPKAFVLYSLVALGFYAALYYASLLYAPLLTRFHILQPVVASIFIATSLLLSLGSGVKLFYENSSYFEDLTEKFKNPIPSAKTSEKLNVLLYVGESTSVMNMGLYGYNRNTTPLLSKLEQVDEALLKFKNVFSTHTHTSPSLLEALSIGLNRDEDSLPINDRRRISIIDILNNAGVNNELYSNQGQTGSNNFTSSILFKNAAKRVFSSESKFSGNAVYAYNKPWDNDFFRAQLRTQDLDKKSSTLIVFHSYAGHGNYTENIPLSFRGRVDDEYRKLNNRAITGQVNSLRDIEGYDSAIKYIDFAVFSAIETVKNSKQPWAFLYLSDHGDAVFPARGHDSSRFIHEMVRVPFVIYFNTAAQAAYPDLFQKYSRLSATENTATLAQLPSTLFDLLGVVIEPALATPDVIGTKTMPLPIVIRQTVDGITAVNLSSQPLNNSLIDASDSATRHFVAANSFLDATPAVCYHRSNTIAKALRGSLATNCLEIDIVVDENGTVLAYHPPATNNTGLTLKDIFSAVESNQRLAFWLDGKNLNSDKTCDALQAFLADEIPLGSIDVLVEFPTGTHKVANELTNCFNDLIKIDKVIISYYVPTGMAIACSKHLSSGKAFEESATCNSLQTELSTVKETGFFTDISFDFAGVRAIEQLEFLSSMSWNTWHVSAEDLVGISPARFRMIIMKNEDPNNI